MGRRARRRLLPAQGIQLVDLVGFEVAGDSYVLCFDPTHPWPHAGLTVAGKDSKQRIAIAGEVVVQKVEERR